MSAAMEQHYTVQEVASALHLSLGTVRNLFLNDPDVVRISMPRLIGKRKYRPRVTLRIPASSLDRLKQNRGVGPLEIKPRRGFIK